MAASRLPRILDGDGVFVSTGQQPLLFLGPLYVLYKACAAVRLARRIEAALGIPALALFWIAADDHDWNEVAMTRVVDRDGTVRKLALEPGTGMAGRSVGPAPLPAAVESVLDEFARLVGTSEFADAYLETLREGYAAGKTFSDAFSEVLGRVMEGAHLVLLDGASQEVRGAAAPLIRRVLESHAAVDTALAAGQESVEAAGYEPRLAYLAGAAPVFYDTGEARERLYVAGSTVRSGRRGGEGRLSAFLEQLQNDPGPFSPNVALRPVLESWLLPTAVSVLGPGEIDYWAQLGPLFSLLEVTPPVIAARDSWRVIEGRVDRVLERAGVGAEDLADGGHAAAARVVREARPERLQAALDEMRSEVTTGFGALEEISSDELPGARSAVGKAGAETQAAIARLQSKVDARVREHEKAAVVNVRRAAGSLFPKGIPQERVASPYPYLVRYGPPLLAALLSEQLSASSPGVETAAGGAVAGDPERE
jgi:bacillithiol biosynthesis cysteine-adding enzyme BshC